MTLDEWMYEEEQRIRNGIERWKEFLENKENKENKENRENKAESEG